MSTEIPPRESGHLDSSGSSDQSELPRYVQDAVHGYICINTRLKSFVDTPQFQRLRAIKQLGTSYYVWPGASHNRFEHCLGVAYLARLMTEHLQKNQPELAITSRDVECVEIAGLCHDLGHGPWSHVWDGNFIPRALEGIKWRHEDGSEMMLDYLIDDNEITISREDCEFIKALIAGDPSKCKDTEKPFLFDIVNNSRNGIDVDKFDYILRDTHAIGDKGNLSLERLILSSRVIDNQICYDIKDANQIYELCYTRFSLHKRIYNHKTAKAIEYMIVDALLLAEPHMHIAKRIHQPSEFLHLTDGIMLQIEATTKSELAEARALFRRIRTRDLYQLVDYKIFDWELRDLCQQHITPAKIVEAAKKDPMLVDSSSSSEYESVTVQSLEPEHVIVNLCEMHHGMKEKNPLVFVKFYSKRNPNECAIPDRGDISSLMPPCFAEVLLRIYTRDARYYGMIQQGFRAVLKEMQRLSPTPEPMAFGAAAPSPAATEGASSSRTFSRNSSFTSIFGTSEHSSVFKDNRWTTVDITYAPKTPRSRKSGTKRERDGVECDARPPRKRMVLK